MTLRTTHGQTIRTRLNFPQIHPTRSASGYFFTSTWLEFHQTLEVDNTGCAEISDTNHLYVTVDRS